MKLVLLPWLNVTTGALSYGIHEKRQDKTFSPVFIHRFGRSASGLIYDTKEDAERVMQLAPDPDNKGDWTTGRTLVRTKTRRIRILPYTPTGWGLYTTNRITKAPELLHVPMPGGVRGLVYRDRQHAVEIGFYLRDHNVIRLDWLQKGLRRLPGLCDPKFFQQVAGHTFYGGAKSAMATRTDKIWEDSAALRDRLHVLQGRHAETKTTETFLRENLGNTSDLDSLMSRIRSVIFDELEALGPEAKAIVENIPSNELPKPS